MVDLCSLKPLNCYNYGQCMTNFLLNTTYCQCDQCHAGISCEIILGKPFKFRTDRLYFILSIIEFAVSVLNNSLSLDLFIRSRQIRRTNCGTYLIVYSILAIVSSALGVAGMAMEHFENYLTIDQTSQDIFGCYVNKIGYNTLVYLCIWFSACVAFERGLVIRFGKKMSVNRWRSVVVTVVIFALACGSATPFLVHMCDWNNIKYLWIMRGFFCGFYVVIGIATYTLATMLVLISFTRHIRRYGIENGSFMKTFYRLLRTHFFIFAPPIAYVICYLPFTITINLTDPKYGYFPCDISTGKYIIKIFIQRLEGIPFTLTWFLFIRPSKVYMTEFYMNTWSGRCLAKILKFFKPYDERENSAKNITTNLIDHEHDII